MRHLTNNNDEYTLSYKDFNYMSNMIGIKEPIMKHIKQMTNDTTHCTCFSSTDFLQSNLLAFLAKATAEYDHNVCTV